ncbi:hypothetical protein RAS_p560 (plasmid) [Rickettsia asiatica]|uniref:Uncharacterized protein n=1 Tax=Rickettsia asiatica TaxID=238800 RepID=A0A510G960_9RICK|nr:hypothetical protein RAS_p560 [Rickettsia asiatica]
MLLRDFRNIKFFQDKNSKNITKNIKKVTKETNSGYLATLYSTGSAAIDNYIQLVTYFV